MRVHARKKYATVEIHPLKGIKISWLLKKYVYRIGAHFVLHTKERALKKRIISVPSLLLYYCTRVVPSEVAIYVISRLVVDWGAQGDMGWYMTSLFSRLPSDVFPHDSPALKINLFGTNSSSEIEVNCTKKSITSRKVCREQENQFGWIFFVL